MSYQKYCQFPDCNRTSSGKFAQVRLCPDHLEDIWSETNRFFADKGPSKRESEVRPLYYCIDHLISWSKRSLRRKNGDLV